MNIIKINDYRKKNIRTEDINEVIDACTLVIQENLFTTNIKRVYLVIDIINNQYNYELIKGE